MVCGKNMKILLEDVYRKIVTFLNAGKYQYLVIGGIAAGTIGEPRITGDIDIDILLDKKDSSNFIKKLEKQGFLINEEAVKKTFKDTGTFKVYYGGFHIDFMVFSTELEKEALKRSITLNLYKTPAPFPTPEDLILLKIIPGRTQDLLDIENIITRHKNRLDVKYIMNWAKKLSEEAEDMRFYNKLKKLLL